MKRIASSVLVSLSVLSACNGDGSQPPAKPAQAPAPTPAPTPPAPAPAPTPAEVDVDAAYKALMAKPEEAVPSIEIQHCLISFQGAPRMRGVTRSKDEARALAQKVYNEALGGADFDALVKKYTNDSAPGIYPLTQASRKAMVKDFGDVGFRLKVGEIGVSVWSTAASQFGWHIIKRLK